MPLRDRQAKKSSRACQQTARVRRSGASKAPSGEGAGGVGWVREGDSEVGRRAMICVWGEGGGRERVRRSNWMGVGLEMFGAFGGGERRVGEVAALA